MTGCGRLALCWKFQPVVGLCCEIIPRRRAQVAAVDAAQYRRGRSVRNQSSTVPTGLGGGCSDWPTRPLPTTELPTGVDNQMYHAVIREGTFRDAGCYRCWEAWKQATSHDHFSE
jgi:hypothetical protein